MRRKISIKWILFGTMGIFIVILLVTLWLLQTVYLDNFYQYIKKKEINSAMETVVTVADSDELQTTLDSLADGYGICSIVQDSSGNEIASAEATMACAIHRYNSFVFANYRAAADKEDMVSVTFERGFESSPQRKDGISESIGGRQSDKGTTEDVFKDMPADDDYQRMLLVKKVTTSEGARYIFLNSVISPVDATVHTVRIQLIYVSVIMLVFAAIIAIILSNVMARPIIRLNQSAKLLGKRDFDVKFNSHEYKEVAELSTTLNHAAKELGKAENLQRELLANVSHDLRTPLTMIMAYAEVMRDLPGENSPENVQVIIDETQRLTRLVNDMLDISKIQAGVADINKSVYNLTGSIGAVIDRYGKLMENKGYRITFSYDGAAYVEADEHKMYQVIYNLISNAINYTGDNHQVDVRQTIMGNKVKIQVVDYGEGIPKEELENVWERYYKVDKTHKRAIMGTGLGLSIVNNILKLHNATYGVESTLGEGSCFWFTLDTVDGKEKQNGN